MKWQARDYSAAITQANKARRHEHTKQKASFLQPKHFFHRHSQAALLHVDGLMPMWWTWLCAYCAPDTDSCWVAGLIYPEVCMQIFNHPSRQVTGESVLSMFIKLSTITEHISQHQRYFTRRGSLVKSMLQSRAASVLAHSRSMPAMLGDHHVPRHSLHNFATCSNCHPADVHDSGVCCILQSARWSGDVSHQDLVALACF